MDIRTMYLITAVVFIAAPLGVYYTTRGLRDRGLSLWCVGWILVGAGVLLIAQRGAIPDFISYLVAHAFLAAGYVCRTLSIREELFAGPEDYRSALRINTAFGLLYFCLYTAIHIIGFEEYIRLLFVYCAHILMFTEFFVVSLRIRGRLKKDGALLLAAMAVLMTLGFLLRTAVHVLWPQKLALFTQSIDQVIFLLLLLVGFIIGNYGFVQIRLEKMWLKNRLIDKQLFDVQTMNEKLENVLQEKNKLLRSLSLTSMASSGGGMMSALVHELSQPLNSMWLNVGYLKRQLHSTITHPTTRTALTDMLVDTERLVELVRKVRLMFQPSPRPFERVNLCLVIQQALDSLSKEIDLHRIQVQVDLPESLWIEGEAAQLHMLVLNLVKNAVEALARNVDAPKISISAVFLENTISLSVIDNGPGIPAGQVAGLFDLYQTSKSLGMGVGLWIARAVAEHHQGAIAYADAPGGGACFTVSLPALST